MCLYCISMLSIVQKQLEKILKCQYSNPGPSDSLSNVMTTIPCSTAKILHDQFFLVSHCCIIRPFLAQIKKFKKHFFDGILVLLDRSWCPRPFLLHFVPIQPFSTEIFAFKISSFLPKKPQCQCVRVSNFLHPSTFQACFYCSYGY